MPGTDTSPPGFDASDDGYNLAVTLRPRRRPAVNAVVVLVLAAWSAAGIYALYTVIFQPAPNVWLAALMGGLWILGEVIVLLSLLWSLTGKEVTRVNPSEISISYLFLGMDVTGSYKVRDINLAPADERRSWLGVAARNGGMGSGPVWFEHKGKIVRFGTGLGSSEAKELARMVGERAGLVLEVGH